MAEQGRPTQKKLEKDSKKQSTLYENRETREASERRRKKINWLSKFAGWSGHAALITNCPEYFLAEGIA